MVDLKAELLKALQDSRAVMLAKLDGLSEYDRRRPMTPTGTNLLGLVKHLAGLEYGYLGASFGRPPLERPSWFRDDPYAEIDMWATPDESSDYITGVYREVCAHADVTITELDLDSPGHVEHWTEGHQETTLGVLLIRMVNETAHHAGHADIIRELTDGQIGAANATVSTDEASWHDTKAKVQDAANHFSTTRPEPPLAAGETETVVGFLEYQRATFAWKSSGVGAAGLNTTVGASIMTLGGMLKHLAYYEDHWFSHRMRGNERQALWNDDHWDADPDWEWNTAAENSPEELHTLWQDAVSRSRDLLSETLAAGGLDQPAQRNLPDGRTPSVRWIVMHMIEEYARHNGHADLIRESVDGLTGE